jgi:hypothetical protein
MVGALGVAVSPAGAAPTMTVTAEGCELTVEVGGADASAMLVVTDLPLDDSLTNLFSLGGAAVVDGSPTQLSVWPGSGTLYLYDAMGVLDSESSLAPIASAEYSADCEPSAIELTQTEDLDLAARGAKVGDTLSALLTTADSMTRIECRFPVETTFISAGTTLSGSCIPDPALYEDVEFFVAFVGDSWDGILFDFDATVACEQMCRITAALSPDVDFPGGGTEGVATIEGLVVSFPSAVVTDEVGLSLSFLDGSVSCWLDPTEADGGVVWTGLGTATVDGESYETGQGFALDGTVSVVCSSEDPDTNWSALGSPVVAVGGFSDEAALVEGTVTSAGSWTAECTVDPLWCTFTYAAAQTVVPDVLPPARPAPLAPKYTG